MNSVWKATAVLVLIILAAFVVRFIARDDSSRESIIRQYIVKKGNIEKVVHGTGVLRCSERIEVVSEIKGKIRKIAVKEGNEVKKGDTLAEIENTEIDSEIDVQNALVEKLKKELDEINKDIEEQKAVITARLARDQAKLEYETKQKELDDEEARIKGGATPKYSKDDMDRLKKEVSALKEKYQLAERQYEDSKPTEADRKEADGKYKQEKEKLSLLEKSAKGRIMTSPIDGSVLKVYIEEENLKIDPEKEYEADTPYFLIANLASIVVEGTVFLSNLSKSYQQGKIAKISLMPGKESGRFDVRISFDKPPQGIKEGVRVNFQIVVERVDDTLVVPVEYVKSEGAAKYIMVRTNGADEKRIVKLGAYDDHSYQVVDGLKEGDKIILEMKAGE
jgi:multidrug efflux pump subunit AcrA (membrane-fusion protein)